MSKTTDINDIVASRDWSLIMDILWDDEETLDRMRAKLDRISAANIRIYHKHFCREIEEEED